MKTISIVTLASLAALSAPLLSCQAQEVRPPQRAIWADSSVPRILAQGPRHIPYSVVLDVLRQRGRGQPVAKRKELGDSLVAVAIRTPDAISLVSTINSAGRTADSGRVGTPEPNALDWLIRIHRDGQDSGTRAAAIDGILEQVNPARALPYLRDVATSPSDPTAWLALEKMISFVLSENIGSPAEKAAVLSQLREMWERGLVTNQLALVQFERFARARKWPRRTRP